MSEQIMRENLLVLAQTYATAKGLSLNTVSKRFHGNQAFLADYLAGKPSKKGRPISIAIKTYYDMVNKIRRDWPEGTPWPVTASIPKLGKKVDNGFETA
jgi:hypothetical protein